MTNPLNRKLPVSNRDTYEPPDGYLAVGHIVGVHGLRGEVKVEPYTDFPERFDAGNVMLVGEQLQEMEIESSRPHKTHILVKLKEVRSREDAELLRNQWILIEEEEAAGLEEDHFWVHEILGLSVLTEDGRKLGEVIDVLHTGANDVYVVKLVPAINGQKELLIPAIADVVKNVDLEQEQMVIALLPGMLESEIV